MRLEFRGNEGKAKGLILDYLLDDWRADLVKVARRCCMIELFAKGCKVSAASDFGSGLDELFRVLGQRT